VEAVVLGTGQGPRQGTSPLPDIGLFLVPSRSAGLAAKIIGLANAGGDTTNAIEQGTRLGIVQRGQHFAGLLVLLTDVQGLGLTKAQGLILTEAFYWDMDAQTRAWSTRFARRHWGPCRRWLRPASTRRASTT
jgi:branched-chain amino acid transport system substrate-binding protein